MNVIELERINRLAQTDPKGFIDECEENYRTAILNAAQYISKNHVMHPTVLISGPSGSGKTTSAVRIEAQLERLGIGSHTISMDDYFYSRDEIKPPLDSDGKEDLESPLCVDSELLKKHIEMISKGQDIEVPSFNFNTQRRCEEKRRIHIGRDEVVVFEGIHALNPSVVGKISEFSTGIYISPRTRIVKNDGEVIAPELMRVIRRIIRDNIHRSRTAYDTIDAFKSVKRGEQSYIMPFKMNADISIDSFIGYEGCVLAPIAYKILKSENVNIYDPEYFKIWHIVREFAQISPEMVPEDSVLNEFIY